MKRLALIAVAFVLTGCPKTGNVGTECNPDGTCNSHLLRCEPSVKLLGIPLSEARCEVVP